jgi:hypothetical protein
MYSGDVMRDRRRTLWVIAVAVLATAVAVRHWHARPSRAKRIVAQLAAAPTRSLAGRLTEPLADRHRPFNEAPPAVAAPLPLGLLGELAASPDTRALATAHLLLHDLPRAADALNRLAASADVRSDQSALALGVAIGNRPSAWPTPR